jgi:hypothetical protein
MGVGCFAFSVRAWRNGSGATALARKITREAQEREAGTFWKSEDLWQSLRGR